MDSIEFIVVIILLSAILIMLFGEWFLMDIWPKIWPYIKFPYNFSKIVWIVLSYRIRRYFYLRKFHNDIPGHGAMAKKSGWFGKDQLR